MTGNARLGAFAMGFGLAAAVVAAGEAPAGAAVSGSAAVTALPGDGGAPPVSYAGMSVGGVTQEMFRTDGGAVSGARQVRYASSGSDAGSVAGTSECTPEQDGRTAAAAGTRTGGAVTGTGTDAGTGRPAATGAGVAVGSPASVTGSGPDDAGTAVPGSAAGVDALGADAPAHRAPDGATGTPAKRGPDEALLKPVAGSADAGRGPDADSDAGTAGGGDHGLEGPGAPGRPAGAPTDPEGATTHGGGLPFTGMPARLLLTAAGLLFAIGCVVALLTVRRRRGQHR